MSSGSDGRTAELVAAAQDAMRAGRGEQAAHLWEQVLVAAPAHPRALFHLGQFALMRKDFVRARERLERAAHVAPNDPAVPLNLSFLHRATGDADAEMAALTAALSIDPYFYPALLGKGMLLERRGEKRPAARVYKDLLSIAPSEEHIAPELREALRHAREVVEQNSRELDAWLHQRLASAMAHHSSENLGRFEECREVALGRKRIFTQQPVMLHYPGLPAIQYYPRSEFPWLEQLEQASDTIREELEIVLREDSAEMRPYVLHPDGAPLNQWAELNRSLRWSVFFLWEHGRRVEAHCARCPQTAALLESLPLMNLDRFSPNVMFSVLAAHTRIPAHSGDTNVRLVGHLPLIVPPQCRFRVGNDTREWRYREGWIFDDTIEHEAWNDSDEVRVILIFDAWNPYLTMAERELATALLCGLNDYYSSPP
ncbi:MAG TPA: aspartyl/asparaginyl beta-hydroxylase domain-containing protein [Rhizomicrobium sp.]|jgi:aspartyl/asparaginyl beta-hydroxylase (cupin superfamily)|nr:aspartyl/asparaginyl beta-hydroxylase domain-containing protein [Rhizomicrobium sp.]